MIYIRATGQEIKERYANHLLSFKYKRYTNNTMLSKYRWEIKMKDKTASVEWNVVKK